LRVAARIIRPALLHLPSGWPWRHELIGARQQLGTLPIIEPRPQPTTNATHARKTVYAIGASPSRRHNARCQSPLLLQPARTSFMNDPG
jgi:hypothetical protein